MLKKMIRTDGILLQNNKWIDAIKSGKDSVLNELVTDMSIKLLQSSVNLTPSV